jgi:putative hydrolase of the HAD superfamily
MVLAALLLDAGGTLLTEDPSRQELYARAAARRGLATAPEQMRECMSRAHRALPQVHGGHYRYSLPWFEAFIAHVFGEQLGLERAALSGVREELFAAFADARNFKLMPGAAELLERAAARGLRLGLVSNWSPALPGVLAGLGIARHFSAVVVSAVERVEKPDPAIFERALGRLNVSAAQALHVGNEPVQDVLGANACGIRALLFDPDGRHAALAHERISRLAEVIPWIEREP